MPTPRETLATAFANLQSAEEELARAKRAVSLAKDMVFSANLEYRAAVNAFMAAEVERLSKELKAAPNEEGWEYQHESGLPHIYRRHKTKTDVGLVLWSERAIICPVKDGEYVFDYCVKDITGTSVEIVSWEFHRSDPIESRAEPTATLTLTEAEIGLIRFALGMSEDDLAREEQQVAALILEKIGAAMEPRA